MRWITDGDDGLCLFMLVTDNQLDVIANNQQYYLDAKFTTECNKDMGSNCLITMLQHSGDSKRIWKYFKILRTKYTTVSFWDRGHNKFYTRRGIKCILV